MATRSTTTTRDDRLILVAQIVLGIALLAVWEWLGRTYGSTWSSLPSLIAVRLVEWAAMVRAHPDRLAGDGLHGNETGYRERARAVAAATNSCTPAVNLTAQ